MTEIRERHLDWAIMDRFRQMLRTEQAGLEVTHAFALLQSVLCWADQRIRRLDNPERDANALKFRDWMRKQKIDEEPFSLTLTDRIVAPQGFGPIAIPAAAKFAGMKAERFLRVMRNALGHGDSRRLRPVNIKRKRSPERQLIGIQFDCWEESDNGKTWEDSITLLGEDMRHIGLVIADHFCSCTEVAEDAEVVRKHVTEGLVPAA